MSDNLNNLPPFYVGQKVVYITGLNMPKDSIYVIRDITKHPCGCFGVDVGVESFNPTGLIECYFHREKYIRAAKNTQYFSVTSFRPLQQQNFPLLTYSKVLEKELASSN